MKTGNENSWIMTATDLNFCVGLMGRRGWSDCPVASTERTLQQQMIDSMMRLEQADLAGWENGQWTLKEDVIPCMQCIAWAESTYRIYSSIVPAWFLYCKGNHTVRLAQIPTEVQNYRVTDMSEMAVVTIISDFIRRENEREQNLQSEIHVYVDDGRIQKFSCFCKNGELLISPCEGEEMIFSEEQVNAILSREVSE
ncbi:MAG: hypothetical protein LUC98_01415 [Lachnospiraceae bacterium]|nr:hypothetical protein [Lachnospiraceae bacterium]